MTNCQLLILTFIFKLLARINIFKHFKMAFFLFFSFLGVLSKLLLALIATNLHSTVQCACGLSCFNCTAMTANLTTTPPPYVIANHIISGHSSQGSQGRTTTLSHKQKKKLSLFCLNSLSFLK